MTQLLLIPALLAQTSGTVQATMPISFVLSIVAIILALVSVKKNSREDHKDLFYRIEAQFQELSLTLNDWVGRMTQEMDSLRRDLDRLKVSLDRRTGQQVPVSSSKKTSYTLPSR